MGSPIAFISILVSLLCLILQTINFISFRRTPEVIIQSLQENKTLHQDNKLLLQDNKETLEEVRQNPPKPDFPNFKPSTEDGEYTEYSRWTGSPDNRRDYYALNFVGRKDVKNPIPRHLDVDDITRHVDDRNSTARNQQNTQASTTNVTDPAEASGVHEDLNEGFQNHDQQRRETALPRVHSPDGFRRRNEGNITMESPPPSSQSSSSQHPKKAGKRPRKVVRQDDSAEEGASSRKRAAKVKKTRSRNGKEKKEDSTSEDD
ncbi:MAG: hypothetical protein Q9168_006222 [Polycauliona sp. 1 TL-2023]